MVEEEKQRGINRAKAGCACSMYGIGLVCLFLFYLFFYYYFFIYFFCGWVGVSSIFDPSIPLFYLLSSFFGATA